MCCTFSTCRNIKRWFGQPSDAGGDETMTKSYPCNEQLTRNSRATALNWTGEVCYTRLIITTHEFKPVITYYLGRPTVTSSIIFNCRMKMLMSRISPAPCDCWDSDTFCVCAIHLCIHRHHLQWGRTVWENPSCGVKRAQRTPAQHQRLVHFKFHDWWSLGLPNTI